MGEELKDYKIFFTSTKNGEYKELNCIRNLEIKPISEMNQDIRTDDFFKGEWQGEITIASNEIFRSIEKLLGLSPLSKKRTRKLLMSKGFDRDTAQMYADTMKARNMNTLEELVNDVRCIRF